MKQLNIYIHILHVLVRCNTTGYTEVKSTSPSAVMQQERTNDNRNKNNNHKKIVLARLDRSVLLGDGSPHLPVEALTCTAQWVDVILLLHRITGKHILKTQYYYKEHLNYKNKSIYDQIFSGTGLLSYGQNLEIKNN